MENDMDIQLNEGDYKIDVTSSSSMFNITDCTLHVMDNMMVADITLSGKGYEKLYMGTGEEALSAEDVNYIYFTEDSEGRYVYTVPVKALDVGIDCAAFSIRKQQWYDRTLVFESSSLPKEAFKSSPFPFAITIAVVAAIVCAAAVILTVKKKK